MLVRFRLLSFWRAGTGGGVSATLDSLCARDINGLPLIPGRQVKGLFREAVRELEEDLRRAPPGTLVQLFGSRADPDNPLPDPPLPAVLRFSDARLPEADRVQIVDRPELVAGLFQTRRSTAIGPNGVAKPHSLRFGEVAVPVTLATEIDPLADAPGNWASLLRMAMPLIRAVGSGRTKGQGRVIVSDGTV